MKNHWKKQHKFFSRELDNDLEDLYSFLHKVNDLIYAEQLFKINEVTDHTMTQLPKEMLIDKEDGISSMTTEYYNIFNFKHPALINLLKSLRSMTIEACEYYDVNFEDQGFSIHGWFNLHSVKNSRNEDIEITEEMIEKMPWHDHGREGSPFFHGYYSVSAEPSKTYYKVFGKDVIINNKNNVAILSETGHAHAMAPWNLSKDRITIAYDIFPINKNIDPIETYNDNKFVLL
jgi:hypothetical protein